MQAPKPTALRRQLLLVLGLIAVLGGSNASAEETETWAADAARGKSLAERLCVTCHVVSETQEGTVTAGPPTFASIANRPGQTRERIRNVLINPHPPMPDVQITRHEIDDLIAYLDTMRSPNNSEPLLKIEKKQPKLDYPEPS